jgi:rhodanese-related sulfurtransferase
MRRTVNDMVREAKARIEELSVEQLQAEIAAGTCTVIDIRDFRERLEKGAIPGAISAPRGMLEFWFDPESPYYREAYQFDHRAALRRRTAFRSRRSDPARHRLHRCRPPRTGLQRVGRRRRCRRGRHGILEVGEAGLTRE